MCAIGWWGVARVARGKKDCEQDQKKNTDPAKIGVGKNKFGKFVAREDRPMSPTKKALKVALRATCTSGKALYDKRLNTFAVIWEHCHHMSRPKQQQQCTANCTAVLL